MTIAFNVLIWLLSVVGLQDIDKLYPLGPQLSVLARDTESASYRKLVTQEMLVTDLAAEWQRVETEDNPQNFADKHGGKEKVLADPDLKRAYERRLQIRERFLDLMREGYRRYKQTPPFDRGEKAESAGTTTRKLTGTTATLGTSLPAPGSERHWPRFRGPSGQGLTGLGRLPVEWSNDSSNIAWRSKLAGFGNSSPIVWGDRVFLTSASADGSERFVHCLNVHDGRTVWSKAAPATQPEPSVRDKNGFASATPVTDGERLIAFLGSCGLLCYDLDGKLLWHYDAMKFDTTHGTGSSPLLYNDLVIFIHDQNRTESVCVALDKNTGKVRWTNKRKRAMTWSTPVVVRVHDHDELVFAGGETVKGYDPATGEEIWTLTGPTQEVVPTIVVAGSLLVSASGRNGPTIGLRPGGKGDVTETHLAWRTVRGGPHVPSPIYVAGRLYTVNDFGIATCMDAATGKLIWQDRLRDKFSASPIEAGGLLYFPSETGVTYVLRAGERFDLVAENDLASPVLASPAVAAGKLLLRTADELICIASPAGN
jgi:outer membrane protein assembly factor BamB